MPKTSKKDPPALKDNTNKPGPFEPGELIFQEQPWMHCLVPQEFERRCYGCFQELVNIPEPRKTNDRCSGCKSVLYCSVECQKADWNHSHKYECKFLGDIVRKGLFSGSDQLPSMLMLKVVAKFMNLADDKRQQFFVPREGERTFWDLESRLDTFKENTEMVEKLTQLRSTIGSSLQLTPEQLEKMPLENFVETFARIKCNMFFVHGAYFEDIAVAIYLKGSTIPHSCKPNVFQTFVNKRLTIRTTHEVENLSQLRISYIDHLQPLCVRRKMLEDLYHFKCQCEACSDPKKDAEIFALKCVNLSCNAKIPSDERANEPCPECGQKGEGLLEEFLAVHKETLDIYREQTYPAPLTYEDHRRVFALEKVMKKLYHPENPLWAAFYTRKARNLKWIDNNSPEWGAPFRAAREVYRQWLSPFDPRIVWCSFKGSTLSILPPQFQHVRAFLEETPGGTLETMLDIDHSLLVDIVIAQTMAESIYGIKVKKQKPSKK